MADTVDEDYRFETLPHTTGKDRRDMVERKLKQLYRSTPFYGSSLQEREDSKRRDDRYLFAALTNPEVFNPWLRILTASGLPIAGVFPVPMVSLGLIKKLELKEPNLLLVSKHEAGVRQTFVKDQRFRISRLTPIRAGGRHHRVVRRGNPQHADVSGRAERHARGRCPDCRDPGPGRQPCHACARAVVRGRRNLRPCASAPRTSWPRSASTAPRWRRAPDALHLFLLGQQKSPDFNLAPPALTSGFTRHLVSRGIYAAQRRSSAYWPQLGAR